jgi:hypothetical protein
MIEHRLKCSLNILPRLYFIKPGDIENIIIDGPMSELEDNVAQLLYNMSTVDQMKKLNACGDVQFLYLFRNWARFAVTASVAHEKCNIKIKNLGR